MAGDQLLFQLGGLQHGRDHERQERTGGQRHPGAAEAPAGAGQRSAPAPKPQCARSRRVPRRTTAAMAGELAARTAASSRTASRSGALA